MFEDFYRLVGPPFKLGPDHRFFFPSKNHDKALSYLRYGLQQDEGFIVVTGDIAFVAGGEQGVLVFHIGEIEKPELEGAIATDGNAHGVALDDGVLHIAQANGGLVASELGVLPE